MKNISYSFLTVLFVLFANISDSFSQQINPKITEVYGDKTQELVLNDSDRLLFLTDLLDNRITILESPRSSEEKYHKLSESAIVNKYNQTLIRDTTFNIENFNPLKYDLIFSSKKTEVYRIDNTDFIIVIQPQTIK